MKCYEYRYYGINWKVYHQFKEAKDSWEVTVYAQHPVDSPHSYTTRLRIDIEISTEAIENTDFYTLVGGDGELPGGYEFTDFQKLKLYSIYLDDLVWNTTKIASMSDKPATDRFSDADKKFLARAIDTYPNSPEEN